jgi:hypothetical protein
MSTEFIGPLCLTLSLAKSQSCGCRARSLNLTRFQLLHCCFPSFFYDHSPRSIGVQLLLLVFLVEEEVKDRHIVLAKFTWIEVYFLEISFFSGNLFTFCCVWENIKHSGSIAGEKE